MFIYTQMPRKAAVLMLALGIPFYLASLLVGLAWNHRFPGLHFVALFSPLLWSYAYSKSLVWFVSACPLRPVWQFLAGVLTIEALAVAALLCTVAA
jgi:hypothetical protein